MTDFEDDDDKDGIIEYGDVKFFPDAIMAIENALNIEVAHQIRKFTWSSHYYTSNGERRFGITFALGVKLEFRIAIGTTLNIIVRGINVLPGGQASMLHPDFMGTLINILQRCHNQLHSSSLVLSRDLKRWREDHRKWKTDTFTYEIPEELLFQIPKNETDCLVYEKTVRLVLQDRITKAMIEVTGVNEDDNLIYARGASKLYTLRELREL